MAVVLRWVGGSGAAVVGTVAELGVFLSQCRGWISGRVEVVVSVRMRPISEGVKVAIMVTLKVTEY